MVTKILIIRLSSIGDILHTMTVLPDIKNKLPNCEIDWLVDANFEGVVKLASLVDNVISIPLRKWKKNKLTWLYNILKFKKITKLKQYDYIIDTQGLIKSAFLAKLLFSGPVYGLDNKSAREKFSSLFYNYKYEVKQNNVAVIRLRGLISKIFELDTDLKDYKFLVDTLEAPLKFKNDYVLLLHGTSKDNKKWDLDNWIKLINWFIEHIDENIVVTYSNSEELNFVNKLAKKITNDRFVVIDKLNFAELSGLIKKSSLVIGVDTGFTHMANLLRIPTIAIYLHSKPSYVGIVESNIAFNLGGFKENVSFEAVTNCITGNKLIYTHRL
ncbi:MAG: lipopolysaccharide heptosyltransferase I [Burkholderiales bacterium]|jgi:heptosyltransferase-1|nr:lipopolysaccharide heptosyltransferase I [Burkholderiales bacterium]